MGFRTRRWREVAVVLLRRLCCGDGVMGAEAG